jgi:hypothetical protein
MRIDMLVVLTVVFVAGGRHENRVEVQHLDPQTLQVVQLVDDPLNVAAVEAADIRVCRTFGPVIHMLGMTDGIIVLIVHDIIGRISVAETIRENLILNGAFGPCGNMEPRNKAESIGRIEIR